MTAAGVPVRYRVVYGGRAGSKSWEFARRLIKIASQRPVRVLCTREIQKSINDSVHRVLRDQISLMGLDGNYDSGENHLRSHIGSNFIYRGLRHNAQEIKSLEGIDICWIEEGNKTSRDSWEILYPTIRKSGSEIWVSFNPDDKKDPLYDLFVNNPPDNAIVKKIGYEDNPWFTDESRADMEHCKRTDYDAYLHIWEGHCKKHSDAQIFLGKYIVDSFEPDEEEWDGPFFGADWGFSVDPTTLIKCWVHDSKLYIEYEEYGLQIENNHIVNRFDNVPGARTSVIRADNSRPETISHVKNDGYKKIKACKKWKGSVEDGIQHIRSYDQVVIHPRCKNTIDEFNYYSYKVDKVTGDILNDIVDRHNHCVDAIRYALEPLITKKKAAYAVGVKRTC